MSNNLDEPNAIPRSREHAEYCIHTFILAELWDQYGIVGDLTVCVKSGSTPVRGPVKSRRKQTKGGGRGLDKRLVRPELVTTWIQRLRTTSIDPLHRFRSRRGDRDRDGDGQDQE